MIQGEKMISVIICSRNKDISDSLKVNIQQTIGNVSYELVIIDNSANSLSIFQAYNLGYERSKYSYLCYIHEDIFFRSNNWGEKIIEAFNSKDVGLIGVIGGLYVGNLCRSWGDSGLIVGQFIQGGRNKEGKKFFYNEYRQHGCDVVAVDGLFIASKRELFTTGRLRWDEDTYDGFHFYDMDISMQVLQTGLKVRIVDEILIQHNSHSIYNESFYKNYELFHKKWKDFMPVMSFEFSPDLEKKAYFNILRENAQIGIRLYRRNKMLKYLPYKLATKIMLSLGYEVW